MKRFGTVILACSLISLAVGEEIPVPPIRTAMKPLPGPAELPARPEMPDVMVMNDGTRVKAHDQWRKRREEIKRTLEYYATGRMPPLPNGTPPGAPALPRLPPGPNQGKGHNVLRLVGATANRYANVLSRGYALVKGTVPSICRVCEQPDVRSLRRATPLIT